VFVEFCSALFSFELSLDLLFVSVGFCSFQFFCVFYFYFNLFSSILLFLFRYLLDSISFFDNNPNTSWFYLILYNCVFIWFYLF